MCLTLLIILGTKAASPGGRTIPLASENDSQTSTGLGKLKRTVKIYEFSENFLAEPYLLVFFCKLLKKPGLLLDGWALVLPSRGHNGGCSAVLWDNSLHL